jgi:hypothetical protein
LSPVAHSSAVGTVASEPMSGFVGQQPLGAPVKPGQDRGVTLGCQPEAGQDREETLGCPVKPGVTCMAVEPTASRGVPDSQADVGICRARFINPAQALGHQNENGGFEANPPYNIQVHTQIGVMICA